jgi:hypothetical protein
MRRRQQCAEVGVGADQDPIVPTGGLHHYFILGGGKAKTSDVNDVPGLLGEDWDQPL